MRARGIVSIGVLISIALGVMLMSTMPPTDNFLLDNPFWNGLSRAAGEVGLRPLSSLTDLTPRMGDVLLIIGPSRNFTLSELDSLRRYLLGGGSIILADDFGSGNQILEALEVAPRLNGSLLVDPLFKERDGKLPRIMKISGELAGGIEELVLNYPTVVEGCGETLASSSPYSFLDLDLDGIYDDGEPKGPFTVICKVGYGRGELILISDSSIFINAMLEKDGNMLLLKHLTDGRSPLIDVGHWEEGVLARVKRILTNIYGAMSSLEGRYTIVALLLILMTRLRVPKPDPGKDEVEKILDRNPNWDRKVLERLREEIVHES